MHFDLLTWPGYLCYTGDMGTYVFRRLHDMFQFFRRGESIGERCIDIRYWAEKLEAIDRVDGVREWTPEKFREEVRDFCAQHVDAAHNTLTTNGQQSVKPSCGRQSTSRCARPPASASITPGLLCVRSITTVSSSKIGRATAKRGPIAFCGVAMRWSGRLPPTTAQSSRRRKLRLNAKAHASSPISIP